MTAFGNVPIEAVREFWDRRPCNLRHSPAAVGSRAYFDQVAERKYFVEPHIPGFAEFDRWSGQRVLEIGCGIGTDTMSFARAGARVTAVDLSPKSLDLATQRAGCYGFSDRVAFHLADAQRIDEIVTPAPHDLIYSFGVIHHAPDPAAILRRALAFAGPNTTLKVMVYHRYCNKVLRMLMTSPPSKWLDLDALIAQHSEAQSGCPVTYAYSRRTGEALLESAGWDVTESRVEHIFPWRIKDYVDYRYVKALPWRLVPERAFAAIERQLGWHLCMTARPRAKRYSTAC